MDRLPAATAAEADVLRQTKLPYELTHSWVVRHGEGDAIHSSTSAFVHHHIATSPNRPHHSAKQKLGLVVFNQETFYHLIVNVLCIRARDFHVKDLSYQSDNYQHVWLLVRMVKRGNEQMSSLLEIIVLRVRNSFTVIYLSIIYFWSYYLKIIRYH